MKKLSVIFAAVMVAMLSITSCSKDDNSSRTDFTPEQHKQEIVKAVSNAANNIKGADQGDLLRVINQLYVLIKGPDQPEPQVVNSIQHMLATTKALCETNNPYVLSQYANSSALDFSEICVTFTYNEELQKFEAVKNNTCLECRFNFEGKPVVFNVTPSKEFNACHLSATVPEGEGSGLDQRINIPKKLNGSITWGDKKLFTLNADAEFNESLSAGKVNIRTDANGYKFALSLDANPTKADLNANFTIRKQEILDVKLNLTGNGFTEAQKIVDAILAGQDKAMQDSYTKSYTQYCVMGEMVKLFSTAKAEITLMDDVVVKAHIDDVTAVLSPLFVEVHTAEQNEKLALMFVEAFKAKAGVELYYTDGNNSIASLEIVANMEKKQIDFNIVFAADGSRVPVETLFDEAFLSELKGAIAGKVMELVSFMPDLIEGIMPA